MFLKNKDKILIIIIAFILIMPLIGIIRGQKDISSLENRKLNKIPNIMSLNVFENFSNGEFQKKLEDGISDQMILGMTAKIFINKIEDISIFRINDFLYGNDCTNKYIPIKKGLYYYNCDDYMVYKNIDYNDLSSMFDDNLESYNYYIDKYPNIKYYAYFVDRDVTFNFEQDNNYEAFEYLRNNLNIKDISKLDLNGFKDFTEYFFKTDHHWNYKGSYQGYKDIITMIYPKDELLLPLDEKCFEGAYFWGSKSKKLADTTIVEQFCAYKFDLPYYIVDINGKNSIYGNKANYFTGNYLKSKKINYYSDFYGRDEPEIIYDFKTPNKDNLLVLADSYSNAVNDLIASHFNKTFIIDLRYYENEFDKQFDFDSYVKDNKINKVLFLGNYGFFYENDFILRK